MEPLSHYNIRKRLKFKENLKKIPVKKKIGINFNISSCKPKVCIALPHRYLLKISQTFSDNLQMAAFEL